MGFDRPWYVQYVSFVGNALRGDFGYSFIRHKPAYEVITEQLPSTIKLAAFAFVLSIVVSIPLGVLSATRAHSADRPCRVRHRAGRASQSRASGSGILLILFFGVDLKWLPISGSGTLAAPHHAGNHARGVPDRAEHAADTLLDARLHAEAISCAPPAPRGSRKAASIYAHVLRNSLLPIVTAIGLEVGFLLGGSVIIETIFGWPGVGREIVAAIGSKDFYRRPGRRDHAGADLRRREPLDRPDLHVGRSADPLWRLIAPPHPGSRRPLMAASDIDHRPAAARSQFLPRLFRSKIAVVSAFILALVFFAAIAAPLIAPNDPAESI